MNNCSIYYDPSTQIAEVDERGLNNSHQNLWGLYPMIASSTSIKFIDDIQQAIDEDLKKIQMKPSQYIGALGTTGVTHLAKELINNNIDECINPNSVGNNVWVKVDLIQNEISSLDDGRGMPFNDVETYCTVLQSSSKFNREQGGASAGENGCGLKATNALSESFIIESTRNGEFKRLEFNKGDLVSDRKVRKCPDKEKHGLFVSFRPSPIFMGKECTVSDLLIRKWLQKIQFTIPKRINIFLTIIKKDENGKRITEKFKYKNTKGLLGLLDEYTEEPKRLSKNFSAVKKSSIDDIITVKNAELQGGKLGDETAVKRALDLELYFNYSDTLEPITDTFCNFVNTVDGGVHVEAIKNAIKDLLRGEASKLINKKDSDDLTIMPRDVEQGLNLVMNLATDMNPGFDAQIKSKVANKDLYKPLYKMATEMMTEYFDTKPGELKTMAGIVKANAKARVAGANTRKLEIKKSKDPMERHNNSHLTPENNANAPYKELIIVEGKSAGNRTGRWDAAFQAIFRVRGFTGNPFKKSLAHLMGTSAAQKKKKNVATEYIDFVNALGAGVGPTFDLTRLEYDSIIIDTDADADGNAISNILMGFMYKYMKPIILEGKLFRVEPPLYQIKIGKTIKYVTSKIEYTAEYQKEIEKNVSLIDTKGNKVGKQNVINFLYMNRYYLDLLDKKASHYSLHPDILEFVLAYHDRKDFAKLVKKRFKEMEVTDHGDYQVMAGAYAGKYQLLNIDEILFGHVSELLEVIKLNKTIELKVMNKSGETKDVTIGKFLRDCERYRPTIEHRYKGLGELNVEELADTAMNPYKRKLIQVSITDIEKDDEIMEMILGDDIEQRKAFYQGMDFDRDHLDN